MRAAVAQRVVDAARRLAREVVADRVTGLAAEIAFFGVLALFPALLMFVSALGWLEAIVGGDVGSESREVVSDTLHRVFTEDAGGVVADVEQLFREQRAGLLTISTLGALWALSRAFGALIVALDLAYDLPEPRPWVRQRAVGLAIGIGTVLAAAVVLAMVVLGPLLGGGMAVADQIGLGDAFAFVWTWVRLPAAFTLLVVWVTTLFQVGPAHDRPWRDHLPGGVLSAVGWLAVSAAFNLYLRVAGSGNPVYGVLGGAVALLLWVYALSFVLLVAAELNGLLLARSKVADDTT